MVFYVVLPYFSLTFLKKNDKIKKTEEFSVFKRGDILSEQYNNYEEYVFSLGNADFVFISDTGNFCTPLYTPFCTPVVHPKGEKRYENHFK